MFKSGIYIKATVTTLAACILMACGGENNHSNAEEKNTTSHTYKTATHSYTILMPKNGAQVGKTVFDISIKDDTDTAVHSVTPSMTPTMTMGEAMGGHNHSTPATGCTETDIDGNSECTVYFLMASKMANGNEMGTWDLSFSLPEAEGVVNYSPEVLMNSNVKAQLKGGANDQIPTMTNTEARTYYIFNNGITQTGETSSVELFIATKESMMSFPTLIEGAELNAGLTLDDIEVKVSTDNSNWIVATSAGQGIWTAAEISALPSTLFIALAVNGEIKTTDGEVAGTDNSSTQISLTTSAM
jgi:hypothetical protein